MIHPTKEQARLILAVGVFIILSTAVILWASAANTTRTNDLIHESQRNHDSNLCLISVIKQITPASGQSQDQTRQQFNKIFTREWLTGNCNLTTEEADRILAGR